MRAGIGKRGLEEGGTPGGVWGGWRRGERKKTRYSRLTRAVLDAGTEARARGDESGIPQPERTDHGSGGEVGAGVGRVL